MTHHPDQRWTAATKDEVTRAVLAVRDDEAFLTRFRAKIDTRNNEHHLEPVQPAENTRRGRGVGRAGQRAMRSEALRARDAWQAELARPLILGEAA